jgi:PIF1 helicase.
MLIVDAEQGGFFFLDAPGGTDKTFLISLILAKIRSQQKTALEIASSGIAAILLDGGRTAHSAFKLPSDIYNKPADITTIPSSTFADEINACLKQSFLWRSVETLRLIINMRVQLQNDPSAQVFSKQLLDIGNS